MLVGSCIVYSVWSRSKLSFEHSSKGKNATEEGGMGGMGMGGRSISIVNITGT